MDIYTNSSILYSLACKICELDQDSTECRPNYLPQLRKDPSEWFTHCLSNNEVFQSRWWQGTLFLAQCECWILFSFFKISQRVSQARPEWPDSKWDFPLGVHFQWAERLPFLRVLSLHAMSYHLLYLTGLREVLFWVWTTIWVKWKQRGRLSIVWNECFSTCPHYMIQK